LPILVIGCSRSTNTFEVHAPEAASAELQLCGRATNLERSGDWFTASRSINCEGHGSIVVHLPEQKRVSCPIGYVTPGSVQSFKFQVTGDQCK
jgi:hypothetical protein